MRVTVTLGCVGMHGIMLGSPSRKITNVYNPMFVVVTTKFDPSVKNCGFFRKNSGHHKGIENEPKK